MSRMSNRKIQSDSINNLFKGDQPKKRGRSFHIYGVNAVDDMMDIVGRSKRARIPMEDITEVNEPIRSGKVNVLSISNLICSSQTSVSTVSQPILEEISTTGLEVVNASEFVGDSEEDELIVPTSEMHEQFSRASTIRETGSELETESQGKELVVFDSQLGNFDEELEGGYVEIVDDEEEEEAPQEVLEEPQKAETVIEPEEVKPAEEQVIEPEEVKPVKDRNPKKISSLQELCLRANNHKLPRRVGLSKRVRIESLHKNIGKR